MLSDGGMVYPDEFIPVIEKNGYVLDVDNYMWDRVCYYIKKLEQEGVEPVLYLLMYQECTYIRIIL